MPSNEASLEILIQIRDELSGLNRAREGLGATRKEAEGLGKALKQGLGIGGGIELMRRGVDLLRASLSASVGDAFRLAREIQQNASAVGITTEAYQVFKNELHDSGVEMNRLFMATTQQTESLKEARAGVGAATDAYKDLGLVAAEIERLSPDARVLAVAHATLEAADQTKAYAAAGQILGTRQLPMLLGALKRLSTEGYDKLAEAQKRAGRIMDEDTTKRLRDAERNIDELKQKMTIAAGEVIGTADAMAERTKKSFWQSALAANLAPLHWAGLIKVDPLKVGTTPRPSPGPHADSTDPSFERPENVVGIRIADNEQRISQIRNASLLTEHERRKLLVEQLDRQEKLYQKLAQVKFGEEWQLEAQNLRTAAEEGNLTEKQLTRLGEILEVEGKITEARQARLENQDKPLAALYREVADTSGLIEMSLEGGIVQGVQALSSGIWSMAQGTGKASDMWRSMGNIAGQVLTDLFVKMMILRPLLSFFFGPQSAWAPPIPGWKAGDPVVVRDDVVVAGGGTFVTRGPTNFTVGDNPGGVELVSVLPISGIGQTTVNGQALRMAGGGAALVGGSRAGAGASGQPVTVNFNFATGVAATVRAEILSMSPHLRMLAVDAVQEAHLRNKLRI